MFSFLLFLSVLTVDILRIFWYYIISNILTKDYSDEIGKILRNIFIKMGPTGIKIGQVLSHRIDILPQNICIILSKLTDNLPGIGMNQEKKLLNYAKKIVNYNSPPIKIGAGCIAVTYLTTVNNNDVVMKIKRPNIDKDLEISFNRVYNILYLLSKFGLINLNEKIDKIRDSLFRQTDFDYELSELEYFYKRYNQSNLFEKIIIPKPYPELSDKNIITLEYLRGNNVDNLEKKQKEDIANTLWDFCFHSSFIDGHWHSDLHKGNLLCMDDKLGIIDFGLTGSLKGFEKSIILNYNTHILKKEWFAAARLYVSKMTEKCEMSDGKKINFEFDITNVLSRNFEKNNPDMITCVSEMDNCSRHYGTRFNNRYAKFELAFSTMASTMVELGHNNIYSYMEKTLIKPKSH
tara:strand:- start:1148 stop:2362 length:1215 start_codon:yes stop_codon:yes gene_type:complete